MLKKAALVAICSLLPVYGFCEELVDAAKPAAQEGSNKPIEPQYQKIIDEYKEYLRSLDPKVREEVNVYRSKIKELMQQKRLEYRQLSQAAQNHLIKEHEFKKKLPIKDRQALYNAAAESAAQQEANKATQDVQQAPKQ